MKYQGDLISRFQTLKFFRSKIAIFPRTQIVIKEPPSEMSWGHELFGRVRNLHLLTRGPFSTTNLLLGHCINLVIWSRGRGHGIIDRRPRERYIISIIRPPICNISSELPFFEGKRYEIQF